MQAMRDPSSKVKDEYGGFAPKAGERIAHEPKGITPEELFTKYIRERRPVVIDGLLTDEDWKGEKWTDLSHLRKVCGSTPVKIEPVHPTAGHFGTSAARRTVPFSEYLDLLQDPAQAGKYYLTTQYDEEDDEARGLGDDDTEQEVLTKDNYDDEPEPVKVCPAPTNALIGEFPHSPKIMGGLVLQQCNLWLGNSKEAKSSGLHHDFHDNLYMLLSGQKRFLLFPPSAHRHLHPRGRVERVHRNGLVVYTPSNEQPCTFSEIEERVAIRPDGLAPVDAARWRLKARARALRDIDERAAGGSASNRRKGKAKETPEQIAAQEAYMQAEAELLLARMDEEGIDPYDTDDSNANEESSSDDDDADLESMPAEAIELAQLAMGGDEEAFEELQEFLAAKAKGGSGVNGSGLKRSADAFSDESEDEDEEEKEDDSDAGSVEEADEQGWMMFDDMEKEKRRIEDAEAEGDDDDDEEDDEDADEAGISGNQSVDLLGDSDDDGEESEDSSDAEEFFPGGDDPEMEGDVEDGEAALAALMAADSPEPSNGDGEEDEPPSFSLIRPQTLHAHFGVPDDPISTGKSEGKENKSEKEKRKGKKSGPQSLDSDLDDLRPLEGCPPPLEVHLKPGQMLYLPASWWHEVTSSTGSLDDNTDKNQVPIHMALNYWFHPPDALSPSDVTAYSTSSGTASLGTGTVDRPYRDVEVWDEMRKAVEDEIAALRAKAQTSDAETMVHKEGGMGNGNGNGKAKGKGKREADDDDVDDEPDGKRARA